MAMFFYRNAQLPPSGLVTTLLELAGAADVLLLVGAEDVLLCAGAEAGAGAALGVAGGIYNGPLLPQPASMDSARQAGNSRIDRRMVRDSSGYSCSIAKLPSDHGCAAIMRVRKGYASTWSTS